MDEGESHRRRTGCAQSADSPGAWRATCWEGMAAKARNCSPTA